MALSVRAGASENTASMTLRAMPCMPPSFARPTMRRAGSSLRRSSNTSSENLLAGCGFSTVPPPMVTGGETARRMKRSP
ncbi:MAG: hypothetical protein BWY91_03306 [bacterium ADurb.BinA028]|nr:MAG: hypothetical protein BWY91_03306 [bacterium ADurb.BinA028]